MKKIDFAIQPSANNAMTPSKTPTKASKGLYEFSTRKPTNIPPINETITSFVIIAKAIVNSGITIEIIPYSMSCHHILIYKDYIIMKILLTLFLSLFLAYGENIPNTQQLIVVTTKNWSTPNGKLQRFEKSKGSWKKVGKQISIKLGRNGLGWGIGLHNIPKGAKIIKREGDGKAPAGIFTLKQSFGYKAEAIKYPYSVYKTTDHCVDDSNSKYYNKIIDSTKTKKDYKSFEHMKFAKDYYKYGIVVNHNHIDEKGAVPGAGSCIFMHIKKVPTAGCTVMNEGEMKEIIKWLDASKNPLLVQGTQSVVKELLKKF